MINHTKLAQHLARKGSLTFRVTNWGDIQEVRKIGNIALRDHIKGDKYVSETILGTTMILEVVK